MFPSNGGLTRLPLPSAGSPRVGSPASPVLWGVPTPCRPSRRTSLPSFGDTTRASAVCSQRPRTQRPWASGVGHPVLRPGLVGGGDRVSQVPGRPVCVCRVLRPRRDRSVRPLRRIDAAPAPAKNEGSPRPNFDFGAQWHGLRIAVYASQRGLPQRHARRASGLLGPALSGWDLHPRGLNERFQCKTSPFPRLVLTHWPGRSIPPQPPGPANVATGLGCTCTWTWRSSSRSWVLQSMRISVTEQSSGVFHAHATTAPDRCSRAIDLHPHRGERP